MSIGAICFNDTAPTEIYTLSLHDALPIFVFLGLAAERATETDAINQAMVERGIRDARARADKAHYANGQLRSEEHTSELQSRQYLVCRLLLEKKKTASREALVGDAGALRT